MKISTSINLTITVLTFYLIHFCPITFSQTSPGWLNLDTIKAGSFDTGKMWTFEYPPEEYFKEEYGLDENSHGHHLAEILEETWFVPIWGKTKGSVKWAEYSRLVEEIHRNEMKKKYPKDFRTG